MTTVQELLESGARAQSDRRRFVKLALAADVVSEVAASASPSMSAALRRTCSTLEGQSAADLVSRGTPFLWKRLQDCLWAGKQCASDLDEQIEALLWMLVDSYADLVLSRGPLEIEARSCGDRPLPSFGCVVAGLVRGERIEVSSADDGTLRFVGRSSDASRELSRLPAPALAIPGTARASLIAVDSEMLFDDPYRAEISPAGPGLPDFAEMIGRCLRTVGRVNPDMRARIDASVRFYVPIRTPDRRTHNSFTAKGLQGVMFLSEAYHDLRMLEAIVHEFHHGELYELQETVELWNGDASSRAVHFSPWRRDPRPLEGLIHACYVFSSVVAFLRDAEADTELAPWQADLRSRRLVLVHQLELGLAQIPLEQLSPEGRSIVEGLESEVGEHWLELRAGDGPIPGEVRQHFHRWSRENPELLTQVRVTESLRQLQARA